MSYSGSKLNRVVWLTPLVVFALLSVAFLLYRHGHLPGSNGVAPSTGVTYDARLAILRRGDPNLKEVALTIDDGPHPKYVPKILEVLRQDNVHATFFVVGQKVQEHPEIVREMLRDGNELGNHSMTHPRFITLDAAGVRKEIAGCAAAVLKATGQKMTLVRPPGLRYTDEILRIDKEMNYVTVEENIAVGDYIVKGDYSWYPGSKEFPTHVATIEHNVFKQLKNGAIIVLHDMPVTAAALHDIIGGIRSRGYKIVTVSDMLTHLRSTPN
ncbi:MAG: polysaccharide deacetylase family protein [Fimbriimonas sp.]|nr:polysaccharide deacetylase family protein [Fimbriimonas sp.]